MLIRALLYFTYLLPKLNTSNPAMLWHLWNNTHILDCFLQNQFALELKNIRLLILIEVISVAV